MTCNALPSGRQRLREAWVGLATRLRGGGSADAGIEAEVLLRHVLGLDRAGYFARLSEFLPPGSERSVESLTERRLNGEPLAYITGCREFYGLEFLVDDRVLVPRQETELLVDLALDAVRSCGGCPALVADVGTGSGAIAVTLAAKTPDAALYATDVSSEALEVASANASRHGVRGRISFLCGDLLAPLPEPVDVIVSNPPYVPSRDLPGLPRDVRREPPAALDGGPDGLRVIERLLADAPRYLKPGGSLFVEIAPGQSEAVVSLAGRLFASARVRVARDAMGRERALCVEGTER